MMKQNYFVYAGCYGPAEEAGIHGYRLTRREGREPQLTEVFAAAGVSNPSYLAVSADGKFYIPLWRIWLMKEGRAEAWRRSGSTKAPDASQYAGNRWNSAVPSASR